MTEDRRWDRIMLRPNRDHPENTDMVFDRGIMATVVELSEGDLDEVAALIARHKDGS